jgi:hypothetical protein
VSSPLRVNESFFEDETYCVRCIRKYIKYKEKENWQKRRLLFKLLLLKKNIEKLVFKKAAAFSPTIDLNHRKQ